MIDADGNFIGQICHIEAAEKGGERFNSLMTNEHRRAFENLMLMCYRHHTITNDVVRYPVFKLKKMKADHEATFSDPAGAIARVLEDETAKTELQESHSLERMNKVLGWNLTSEEREGTAKWVNEIANRLKNVPKNARSLVRIIIERTGSVRYRVERMQLPFAEIEHSVTFAPIEISRLLQVLNRHNLASVWDEGDPSALVGLSEHPEYPALWADLLEFAKRTGIPLKTIIDDVQFNVLD
jgi:hypothetical protein